MKYLLLISAILFLATSIACNTGEREEVLSRKAADLNRQEQELEMKRLALAIKEEELLKKEKLMNSNSDDSTASPISSDTLAKIHPTLPGIYNVTMKCTETNCPGSAVGDTKSEQWELAFEKNQVIVKAMSDKKLLRIYKGSFAGNSIELFAQADTITTIQAGNMMVRLQEVNQSHLRGVREIKRQDNCRTLYDLDLQKQ